MPRIFVFPNTRHERQAGILFTSINDDLRSRRIRTRPIRTRQTNELIEIQLVEAQTCRMNKLVKPNLT